MKFTIYRDEIYEALQKVVGIIPQRSTIAMTQNVRLTAEGDQLELTATDLEITVVSTVTAEIEEEGGIALPGRLIHDIIRELPNGPLVFTGSPNYRLELRSELGEYKIGGENPAEFPQKPQLDNLKEIVLPNDVLRRLIDKTIFACSTDELRPALTGVFFEIGNKAIQTVATDGHRLALLKYQDDNLPEEELNAIISPRALNFALRNLEGDGMTALMLGDKHALFHMNNTRLFARLIDEVYVDYRRVLPEETNFQMTVDTNAFLASVRRVSLFSNPISAQVILSITGDRLQVQAQDEDFGGEAREEIPCEFNGEEFVIGFNSRYLQDMLRHIDAPQLVMRFVRPDFAVLTQPADAPENEEQLMLLMPVRLENVD